MNDSSQGRLRNFGGSTGAWSTDGSTVAWSTSGSTIAWSTGGSTIAWSTGGSTVAWSTSDKHCRNNRLLGKSQLFKYYIHS